MRFDGREFAKEVEERVKARVMVMETKPKIVSILVGSDPASKLYTRLKQEAAERVGVEFEVVTIDSEQITVIRLQEEVARIGGREDITGLMIQLPIPGLSREEQREVIRAIPLNKDVDGLRWEKSGRMPATVRAIFAILERIAELGIMDHELWEKRFVVVGARGSVGRPLVHYLRERGVEKIGEVEWDTKEPEQIILNGEVVISCTGREDLIIRDMVSEGAIAIDVGAPRGDMTSEVYEKARVAVGVPGGVGPVTVISLMENVVEIGRWS